MGLRPRAFHSLVQVLHRSPKWGDLDYDERWGDTRAGSAYAGARGGVSVCGQKSIDASLELADELEVA